MMNFKISINNLLQWLIILFVIAPLNYYIGPFNIPSFLSILIVLIYFLRNKFQKINLFCSIPLFWMYIIVQFLQISITSNLISGLSFFMMYFMVTYIVVDLCGEEKIFFNFIKKLITVGVVLGILGIFESIGGIYIFQFSLLSSTDGLRYGILRCATTFGHPINMGLFEAIIAILSFYMLINSYNSYNKLYYKISYIIAIVSMICTVSRLAICLFLIVQLFLLLSLGLKKALKYLCISILLLVGVVIISEVIDFGLSSLIDDFIASVLEIFGIEQNVKASTIGFGNRFDLYSWVVLAVGDNWLTGLGAGTEFSYKMYEWLTKTSIEVHYLNIYYQYGIIGLFSLVLSYVNTLFYFRKKNALRLKIENKLSFRKMLFILLFVYFICLFGVQETDTTRVYCILVGIGISYLSLVKKTTRDCEGNYENI